jgi:hypothetical protein
MKFDSWNENSANNLKTGQQPRNIPSNLKLEHYKN